MVEGRVLRRHELLDIRGDETPAVVAQGSPANGQHIWEMDWASETGPVDVYIDGQRFEGTGSGTPRSGRFNMSFGGTYEDDVGGKHAFTARGNFLFYRARSRDALSMWRVGAWTARQASCAGTFRRADSESAPKAE